MKQAMEGFDCISVLAMCVTRISLFITQVINPCIVFKLTGFATKRYSSQVENHLMLFINVHYIFFECYDLIHVKM